MQHSLAELVQLADSENISMGRAALAEQVEQEKATERAVYEIPPAGPKSVNRFLIRIIAQ